MRTTLVAPAGYENKSDNYFEWARQEMAPFVPAHCRRILDVGCGTGTFGNLIKQTRKIEVWGVEPVGSAAAKASTKLDHVINGPFDSQIELPAGAFDCVVFNDVLEHMVAPEQALRYAKSLLSPEGVIVASIPNIQYLPILWQLLFHARWEYTDAGVLDKTHLRFFTKSSIVRMFQSEGYSLQSICGINAYGCDPVASRSLRSSYKIINKMFLGRFTDMKYPQFAVVAKAGRPL
jgi:2-polyprenyl-3-methyl-5-hydroxy-6-metoxy-1,4-benzoquinol methylase